MNTRDKAIVNDLLRFRCLSRDDIIDLHFKGLKNSVTCCNNVMKRLRRDGLVEVNIQHNPYTYFPKPSAIKKDSQKIPHFLSIVDTYKKMCAYGKPKSIIVEPKYGKGMCEPDMFAIWMNGPFLIEVQRSSYSKKIMQEKIQRYERYYQSREWELEEWQGQKKMFPNVLMITDQTYEINSKLRIMQERSIGAFIFKVRANSQSKTPSSK